jgi:predicted metal-binding protein
MIKAEGQKPGIDELAALAKEAGFTYTAPLAMESLEFREEVRSMCSADLCKSYGKSWSCPPAVGSIVRAKERAENYHRGIIVQTAGAIADSFDMDGTAAIMQRHRKNFDTLVRQVRHFYPDCLPMGAGTCRLCRSCTYPDRPCRHPDRMVSSMEAYGLLVSDVAVRSGLGYNYGENTMTFTSCILTD